MYISITYTYYYTGESLANSFNSRYSRHSYENNFLVGAGKKSKQSESSSQTLPEMRDEVRPEICKVWNYP